MKNHFRNLARCSLLIFLFFAGQQLFAQKTITGVVTDGDQKEPLIGGSVLVKGKSIGTITDFNGKYTINASDKDVLVFSYIGMESTEIPVLDKKVINVTLQTNSTQLSEVVAIGYGTVKKSDLTGSVAVVSAKDLTRNPSSSAMQALQGKAPGVLVFSTGAPGGGATIRVRGVGSISKGSEPIYIVDGVQQSYISGIEPQEIENMQVLKDASATAIYGANGSNGVIIINTKRGKSGKIQVNLNSYVGINLEPKQYDMMDAQQYSDFYSQALFKTQGLGKTYIDSNGKTQDNPAYVYSPEFRQKYYGQGWEQGTNWQDLLFNNGLTQNYHLSLAGGGENSNFNVSLGYLDEKGTIINNNAKSYNFRVNSDFKLGKHLKIGENLALNFIDKQSPMTVQASIWDLIASPLMKVYNPYYKGGFESNQATYWEDADGNLQQGGTIPAGTPTYLNTLGNDKPNPIAAPTLGDSKNYGQSTRASVYMQVDFTDWLMYKVTPSVEIGYYRSRAWMPLFTGNRTAGSASLNESYSEGITLNLDNQLVFTKKFNDVHNVQATVVSQVKQSLGNSIQGSKAGFDYEQLNTMSNGGTASYSLNGGVGDTRMLSYLGRIMYDYKGKYFVTGSYRSDGVSVFGPSYRRGNFASASAAWKINEDFFQDVEEIDVLKLRFGWGQTGNSAGIGAFMYNDNLSGTNMFSPVFGTDQHIADARYVFMDMGSKDIHWEAAEMFNLGIDLNMFNNKLQTSVEYYVKNNNNLLIQIPISQIFGRSAKPWYNTGDIQNRGLELSLQWRDNIGKFSYGIISNFTTVKNEVKYLPVTDITNVYNRTIVGHSIGALYGFVSDGIIQLNDGYYTKGTDGDWQKELDAQNNWTGRYLGYKFATQGKNIPQPGDLKYADLNGDGDVTDLDKTIIGKTIPSFNYSLGFDCSYKNFDFNLFLYGVGDFNIYNKQRASLSSINSQDMQHNKLNAFAQNHWTLENASTTYVRVDPSNINQNDRISTFWIEDGSFLRIKDIQMGYTVPKDQCVKLGISSLRLYVNASNLYCFTAYKGRDPEGFISSSPLNGGTDAGGYTLPRSFAGGIQIGF